MNKFLFSLSDIPFTSIMINDQYGRIITPADNGFIGVLKDGTELNIRIKVEGDHVCYTLDQKNKEKRIPKAKNTDGSYTKKLTVTNGQIARWPSNMVCLEVPGHTYNIGIANQNGRYFFVIEEYFPSDEYLAEGMVVWFSILHGIGSVAYKPLFDARIYWKSLRFNSKRGIRVAESYDLLTFDEKDVVPLDGDTSFRYEIKKAVNLSQTA